MRRGIPFAHAENTPIPVFREEMNHALEVTRRRHCPVYLLTILAAILSSKALSGTDIFCIAFCSFEKTRLPFL